MYTPWPRIRDQTQGKQTRVQHGTHGSTVRTRNYLSTDLHFLFLECLRTARCLLRYTSWTQFLRQLGEQLFRLRHFLSGLSAAIRLSTIENSVYRVSNLLAFPNFLQIFASKYRRCGRKKNLRKPKESA